MGIYSKHKMFCTVCGKQYDWDCNYGFSKNRTCGMDCHREFEWRHILSVLGKDYYLRKKLGLDFGNVIKVNGGDMIIGFKEAIQPLKNMFKEEIYLISRVYNEDGEKQNTEWLKKNHLIDCEDPFLERRHINYCFKREEKAPIAQKLGLTHFIDDRIEVLWHMKLVKHLFALNPTSKQLSDFPPDGFGVKMNVALNWEELLPKIQETLKPCQ